VDIAGDNFVILRGRSPVPLLRSHFPDFFAGVGFDIDDDESYFAYGTFADHLRQRLTDRILWARAMAFLSDIATNDPTLRELLSVAVFEPLCEDADVVPILRANLAPAALTLVEEIERFWQSHQ
jgi:hypothetical protein